MTGLGHRSHVWQVVTNHKELHENMLKLGFQSELLPFKRLLVDKTSAADVMQSIHCYKRLRQLIKDFKPEVIHINNGGACQWAVPAGAMASVPTLVHLHAPWSRKMRFLLGLHHPDYIVGVSHAILAGCKTDPTTKSKLHVIYNGIQKPVIEQYAKSSSQRTILGIRPNQFVVGLIGVLAPGKRAGDAISAIRILMQKHGDNITLLVIGDGAERLMLETSAYGLPVQFLGHRTDVSTLMTQVCDAIVLPSQVEAFSLVLLEAAASGLPRIAARAGGNTESIHHQNDGLLVEVGDVNALALAIETIAGDKQLAKRLGDNARSRVIAEFTDENFLEHFEMLYKVMQHSRPNNIFSRLITAARSQLHQTIIKINYV
jgi:glycosyltransferase involved in cell wall biosynthesis